ncbi:metalloregulator ArsR/SmtB family transcription factor [Microvirga sp. W0021]|uniref:Metalloregulator ArsR/SmtB family transcription factor n=1 Tax=Hohaiivirga grylli TaxID=3133970 RepID=A0ABV0BN42_9HYPH
MNTTHEILPPDVMVRNATQAADLLKLLANAKRLEILCTLVGGEKSVGELVNITNLSQSAVSQHLSKLKASGIIKDEKRGQMVYYALASMEVNAILSTLYLIYCR